MAYQPHKPQGGCLIGCLSLLTPRIVIVLLVITTDWVGQTFNNQAWPFLGFLFLPATTLAAVLAHHAMTDLPPAATWGVIALGAVLDLGLIGGGSWGLRPPPRKHPRKHPRKLPPRERSPEK